MAKATKPGEHGNIGKYKHVYSNSYGKGTLRHDKDEDALVGDWSSPDPSVTLAASAPESETTKILRSEKKLDEVAKMNLEELKAEVTRLGMTINLTAPNPGVLVMRLRNAIRASMKKN